MPFRKLAILAAVAFCAVSTVAHAQDTARTAKTPTKATTHRAKKMESQADLMKQARITMDSARAIALAKVPGATVESGEIERENGRLIYSFDLKRAGRSGIDEVNVNALTGKVVGGVQHETPKTERVEARTEARQKLKK